MSRNIQFSFCSAGRRLKGAAHSAETHFSNKLPAGNRWVEVDGFMGTYVGEMHGSE
jgi:hypothetical protein